MAFDTVELGTVLTNLDSKRIPLSSRERAERQGVVPYYGAAGIIDYIDAPLFQGLHLLIGEDGSVLREDGCPILQLANGEFWVNNHAHVVRAERDTDTRYIYYALQKTNIAGLVTGAVQLKLTQGNLNKLRIPYPTQATRDFIVRILGTLDEKIELNRQMAATLEEMARALFKSWFVDFDPVRAKAEGRPTGLPPDIDALFPDELVESELGLIPKGWRIGSIAEIATVGGGSTPSTKNPEFWDGQFSWATPKDLSKLSNTVLLETERTITEAGLKSISSALYPPGTVLMSSRAPIGYLAVSEVPVAVNQGFIALQPVVEHGNLFLLRWLEYNMDAIHGRANGSTFMEISKSAFRSIETVLPSGEIIGVFGRLMEPLHQRLVEATKESALLATIRDILLPRLMSGELPLTHLGVK